MELLPRATEKTYAEEAKHTYVFRVPANASKQAIAKAVAEEFKVTVEDVRTLVRKGKKTRYSKGKHAYPGTTYRQDKHLAYVTVKKGDRIPVFEDPNAEAEEKATKGAKDQKSEAKKEEKGAKK